MKKEWTNDHCERCHDSDNPQLATHEIFCGKHYREWLKEEEEA